MEVDTLKQKVRTERFGQQRSQARHWKSIGEEFLAKKVWGKVVLSRQVLQEERGVPDDWAIRKDLVQVVVLRLAACKILPIKDTNNRGCMERSQKPSQIDETAGMCKAEQAARAGSCNGPIRRFDTLALSLLRWSCRCCNGFAAAGYALPVAKPTLPSHKPPCRLESRPVVARMPMPLIN